MLLDNYPEETERLKKHEKFFEWVTWLILIVSYLITFFPLGLPITRLGINLIFIIVGLTTFITYRVLPFEKRTGLLSYTYKMKGFSIQISDHIFASSVILFSGGINSPFWFVYLLALIAGAMYLPAWAMVVAGIQAISFYLLTVGFLAPAIFGYYEIGLTSQMFIVPVAAFFALIMTYVVAKDLNIELINIRSLANRLRKKTVEVEGERDKLSVVLASISDGVFVLDTDQRLILINKEAAKMFGIKETDYLEEKLDDVFNFMQNETKITAKDLCPNRKITTDEIVFSARDLKFTRPDGKDIYLNLTSSQIDNASSTGIGCICVFQDATRERELEEMKLDFVSMAAHELRTPLTSVRGYLSLLKEELAPSLKPDQMSFIEKAFVSATQLTALIENLLNISNIERGSLRLEVEKSSWRNILENNVKNHLDFAHERNIKLSMRVAKKLPEIYVDRFRISEVLSNLINNAITYTSPGGSVEISVETKDNALVTHVKDTGNGIPEEALPKIFTKFFRVSGPLEQGSKGTGLGLYIAKSIVDMHKGAIWVESKVNVGSTFSFSLPINPKVETDQIIREKIKPSA